MHDIVLDSTDGTMLGWQVDGVTGVVKPTRERVWRLKLAIQHVLRVDRLCGKQLEVVLGHMVFIGLLRREILSLLSASYAFIRRHYLKPVAIWKVVRRELFLFSELLCLVWVDMRASRST